VGGKAEARALRKLAQDEQFERAKAKILEQVSTPDEPKIAHLPADERMRLAIQIDPALLAIPRQPRATETGSTLHFGVSWCVRHRDVEGSWSWNDQRAWSNEEWDSTIHPALDSLGRLTWGEVRKQVSGSGHLMHHEHELNSVCAEAQARWLDLELEQFDTLFRFRLGGKRRFWGFVLQGHFFGVWWDREHGIYPTEKD
jgi:hypothetical protein